MLSRFRKSWFRDSPPARLAKPRRTLLLVEPLEERILLDSTPSVLPPSIVVGRTLSSYFAADVQNRQETITYTVYNEQASPVTGVLLTDTLQSGVAFHSASQLPDQNGQKLAWSLGTIQGFDRASVTLTVSLPSTIPLQLDLGAKAFATLDAGAVSNSTPAAALRSGSINSLTGGAALLASTPDANTTDPFVQEEAAKLNYDPQQIFNFLHNDVGYNSYTGSLRGARGTLWSSAGNALDVASLGVALMRASGIPARYESGTLSKGQAQQLILSMFPASYQTVGYIPAGTQTADPANDPQLLSETESHYWFQFDAGSGMQNADPLMAGAAIGQTFTASTGTFAEVADNLRQKTEVKLTAEMYYPGFAALIGALNALNGGSGIPGTSDTVVLDQTFNDVDLVGRPISIGIFADQESPPTAFSATVNTYTPFFQLGDEANPDPTQDRVINGTQFQEILTGLPVGQQLLTGLFLNVTLSGSRGPSETFEHTLFDRIGYAARQGLGPVNLSVDTSGPPPLNEQDRWTLNVEPGMEDPNVLTRFNDKVQTLAQAIQNTSATDPQGGPLVHAFLTDMTRYYGAAYLATSDAYTSYITGSSEVLAYYDRPRAIVTSTVLTSSADQTSADLHESMDLQRDSVRAIAYPGQNVAAVPAFNSARGELNSFVESTAIGPLSPPAGGVTAQTNVSAYTIYAAALAQGIPIVGISAGNLSELDALDISIEAKARIATAVQAAQVVLVPARGVQVNGAPAIGWYQVDPTTGQMVGVTEDGQHGSNSQTFEQLLPVVLIGIPAAAGLFSLLYAYFHSKEGQAFLTQVSNSYKKEAPKIQYQWNNFTHGSQKPSSAVPPADKGPTPALKAQQGAFHGVSQKVKQLGGNNISYSDWDQSEAQLSVGGSQGSKKIGIDPPLDDLLFGGAEAQNFPGNSASGSVAVVASPVAAGVLTVSAVPATLTTDQNTPMTFRAKVNTGFADTYNLTAQALPGWNLTIDDAGNVTVTPAPGLQGGTYPIQVVAQSTSTPHLVAQTTVVVTLTPTPPGLTLNVVPDRLFSVPFDGADLPFAYRVRVQNLGPSPDTYNLSFANVPRGFTAVSSVPSVTVPAGQTGVVGLYLIPNAGPVLPAPGTQLSFTVTATGGTSNPSITQTQNVSFTMPQVDAVTLTSNLPALNTTPGKSVTATFTLHNVGNVPETVTLGATLPTGLTASGLRPVSLAVGQSTTETVTLTPSASTPLNSILDATITATFGPSAAPVTQTRTLPVNIVVPGAAAIANASVVAGQLGNTALADRLGDLSTALTNLVQNPTSVVYNSQARASIGAIVRLLSADPYLTPLAPTLTGDAAILAQATTAGAVRAAVVQLGNDLGTLSQTLSDEAAFGFTLQLSPNALTVVAGAAADFLLNLQNAGNTAATYDLSVADLPADVTAAFVQNGKQITNVTVQPGQDLFGGQNGVTLELTETGGSLFPAGFTVTATAEQASEITQGVQGTLTVAANFVAVTAVTANPAFIAPGSGSVDVTAQVLNSVNEQQQALASYTVTDPNGKVVFTSTPVALTLTVRESLATADLGSFDTSKLAAGSYALNVTLTDPSGKPLPGGTGRGNVLVGTPVAATLTVGPTALPAGSGTVTNTLTVNSRTLFPNPLTLDGQAATTPTSTTVALGGNLAYVAGTNGIDIVDVSNPASPKLLSTFGRDKIVRGGLTVVRQDTIGGTNYLVIGTTTQTNANQFTLLIYSLANDPKTPQLVSSTVVDYEFMQDMLVQGNTVLVPTGGNFNRGAIFAYFGTVLAIDVSNPAAPQLKGELFNNSGKPTGGNVIQLGGTLVNSQIAYTASSTVTGSNPQAAVGQVLVVDYSDPANLKLVRAVQIPGTGFVSDVAIQGNRALVVGGTAVETDVNAGTPGNLTLTLLDITDPLNPQVLGTTLVTNGTFPPPSVGATKLSALPLGNGQFAVSEALVNGKPVLLLVDPSDPGNVVVTTDPVPALVNEMAVAGNLLYTTSSAGLLIYAIGSIEGIPFTASVQVPNNTGVTVVPGSFNIPPTRTIVGANFDTLEWTQALAFGESQPTFTWQSTVGNLQAGEALPVPRGATVTFTSQGTAGTLTLPPTVVTGAQILALSPASQTLAPAAATTYTVTVSNPTSSPDTFILTVLGVPAGWASLPASVTVAAKSSSDVTLRLTSDAFAALGDHSFTVTADDGNGGMASVQGDLILAGLPPVVDPEAHGIVATLTPAQASAGQGTAARYVVQLTNTGSADDTFSLAAANLPPGVTAAFSQATVDVPPGVSNIRDVTLTLTPAAGTKASTYPFQVTAASMTKSSVTASAAGTLEVVSQGVAVTLTPTTGAPGSTFSLKVTNTGTVKDTFDLSLGGPGALVSKLAAAKVTLASGASTMVTISTTAITFAVPGALPLVGIAKSEGNPAVEASATASIAVPASMGLSAQLTPGVKVIPVPGTSNFLLLVNNTGNSEDAYTATIKGASGPVKGQLLGLDCQPTQTIPTFRLPGLSTGALLLVTNLAAFATGTVTVEIDSLTSPLLKTTVKATISATRPPPPPPPPARRGRAFG